MKTRQQRCEICGDKISKTSLQCFDCQIIANDLAIDKDINFGEALAMLKSIGKEKAKLQLEPNS